VPTLEQNLRAWDVDYRWSDEGEEWSVLWGGSEAQWFNTLMPRVHAFLPADTILEIAPGHGRWTRFLEHHCSRLIAVDVSAGCIDACRRRFASSSHITCHVNDGRSLDMVDDSSIDFVFSFDSLVHAEADVIGSYLTALSRKLRPNGVGFVHHSHVGAYRRLFSAIDRLPPRVKTRGEELGWLPHDHWRAHSMDAARFESLCSDAGLVCIGQEVVNWNSRLLIDAFSMFTPEGSAWSRPNHVFRNPGFMSEADYGRRLSLRYPPCSSRVRT
jgi:hypothetical protein